MFDGTSAVKFARINTAFFFKKSASQRQFYDSAFFKNNISFMRKIK